jgi:periplasmic protein TonB
VNDVAQPAHTTQAAPTSAPQAAAATRKLQGTGAPKRASSGSRAITRFAFAAVGGLVVNFLLFAVMHSLVGRRSDADVDTKVRPVFEFLRLQREETTERKTRRAPERKASRPAVNAAPLAIAKSAAPGRTGIAAPAGDFNPGFSLAGRPYLGAMGDAGAGVGDPGEGAGSGMGSEAIPLVRVNPLYPPRAQSRGIEGWVLLEFTITPQGTTKDIEVLDADPKGYFERAAKEAVRKYKYKPRVVDGVAVDWPGVQLVISFEIEE